MKQNYKNKYKKIPHGAPNITESEFINQPENNIITMDKKETSSFLIRIPLEMKKQLKKYAFEKEYNMNKICIEAINEFLEKHTV